MQAEAATFKAWLLLLAALLKALTACWQNERVSGRASVLARNMFNKSGNISLSRHFPYKRDLQKICRGPKRKKL